MVTLMDNSQIKRCQWEICFCVFNSHKICFY